ncbi:hypothetical protein [Microbacterium sp. T32]|uniref:hypothetical protein n=1 Tax=Microbacterium sp. T32 TaxID=1776083 RepID=UPI000B2EF943|nr:hypothetical protein [Microbacterium sp. T32]
MSRGTLSFHRLSVTVAGVTAIAVSSLAIAISVTFVGAALLAAFAFADGITIDIPFVATFRGFVDSNGSNAVTVDGSWSAALGLILLLAAPLPIFAMTGHRGQP